MNSNRIEKLIEQYLEGNTSLEDEKELKKYFTSAEVPSHLAQFKTLFGYYVTSKKDTTKEFKISQKTKSYKKWIRIAASIIFISMIIFNYLQNNKSKQKNLGTFESPEEAFIATHDALQLVANNINEGLENVSYLKEYENTKKTIFKQ